MRLFKSCIDILLSLLLAGNCWAGISLNDEDYIDCNDAVLDPTDEQMSISAWINPDVITAGDCIVGKREVTGNDGWQLYFDGSTAGDPLKFTISGVVDQTSDATGINAGTWYHVGVTYNKVNIIFYLDGAQLSSHSQTGNIDDASGLDLWIGAKNEDDSASNNFYGDITEVAVWSTPLSAGEMALLGNARLKGMPLQIQSASLEGYWPLDDFVDGSLLDENAGGYKDLSGNARHAQGIDVNSDDDTTNIGETVLSYPAGIIMGQ